MVSGNPRITWRTGAGPQNQEFLGNKKKQLLLPDIQKDIQRDEESQPKQWIFIEENFLGVILYSKLIFKELITYSTQSQIFRIFPGFGSVFILRKKKKLSPQEWIDQKQADWKVLHTNTHTHTHTHSQTHIHTHIFTHILSHTQTYTHTTHTRARTHTTQ